MKRLGPYRPPTPPRKRPRTQDTKYDHQNTNTDYSTHQNANTQPHSSTFVQRSWGENANNTRAYNAQNNNAANKSKDSEYQIAFTANNNPEDLLQKDILLMSDKDNNSSILDLGESLEIKTTINGITCHTYVDTGAGANVITKQITQWNKPLQTKRLDNLTNLTLANDQKMIAREMVLLPISIGSYKTQLWWLVIDNLSIDSVIGKPALKRLQITIDYMTNCIIFPTGDSVTIDLNVMQTWQARIISVTNDAETAETTFIEMAQPTFAKTANLNPAETAQSKLNTERSE